MLYTDSRYVLDGATRWLKAWKARDWRTADKKPVKNIDLWQRLERAMAPHEVSWTWVRGHAGHPENERADALARAQIAGQRDGESGWETLALDSVGLRSLPICFDLAGVLRVGRRARGGST